MPETMTISTPDGEFSAYVAPPVGAGPFPAVVVLQEIFGVNHHIQNVCDRFVADGYVALAPAIFDRVEPGINLGYTADDIERGRSIRGKVDIADMVRDVSVLEEARPAAQDLIAADPELSNPAYARLKRMVLVRYGEALDLGDVG